MRFFRQLIRIDKRCNANLPVEIVYRVFDTALESNFFFLFTLWLDKLRYPSRKSEPVTDRVFRIIVLKSILSAKYEEAGRNAFRRSKFPLDRITPV